MKIALWGNFGTGNLGNECTLAAVVQNLRRMSPGVELSCICSRPEDTSRRHRLPAIAMSQRRAGRVSFWARLPRALRWLVRPFVEVKEWFRATAALVSADALVVTGMGVLADGGEGAMGLPYELFKWSMVAWLLGCRLGFASVGVEAIQKPLARRFILGACRLAHYRSCRDEQSRARLSALGVDTRQDRIFPDLAFGLSVPEPAQLAQPRERSAVAVGLYAYRDCGARGGKDQARYKAYLAALGQLILSLLERGRDVRVVVGDATYDAQVLEDLRRWLRQHDLEKLKGRLTDTMATSFEELLEQLGSVDYVVASRFHNLVLAFLKGIPAVSISYDAKNDALMGAMGLGDYCLGLDNFSAEEVLERLERLEQQGPLVRENLRNRAARYRAELEAQYGELLGLAAGRASARQAALP